MPCDRDWEIKEKLINSITQGLMANPNVTYCDENGLHLVNPNQIIEMADNILKEMFKPTHSPEENM